MRWKHLPFMLIATTIVGISAAVAAPVGVSSFGTPYADAFKTLADTGTTNAVLPAGWALVESGTSTRANQQYAASNGLDAAGGVCSFQNTAQQRYEARHARRGRH